MPKKKSDRKEIINGLAQMSHIGLTILVCVVIGVFVGRFLDGFFGTSPWLLIVFSFLGAGAAFKTMFDYSNRK